MKSNRKKDLNVLFGAYLVMDFVINTAFGFSLAGIRLPSYLEWMEPIENMPFWVYNLLVTLGMVVLVIYFLSTKKGGQESRR